jgi:uracil-DNA glycosylase
VAPVQDLVDEIRQSRGTRDVPHVDPLSGGIHARVLFVLESPAGPAALGSGMLSPDNDDATAAHMWQLYQQSGLSRAHGLHWNSVPWYIGKDGREVNVTKANEADGRVWLDRLMDLLQELRLVVTMGKPAERAYRDYAETAARQIEWLAVAHPSPRVRNGHPHLWPAIEAAFARAAEVSADPSEVTAYGR